MVKTFFDKLIKSGWILFILLLPFTSFPLAGKLLHSSMVAAPSILAIMFLLGVWFIPYFLKNKGINFSSSPLLIFISYAMINALFPFWIKTPIFKNFSILNNSIEAFGTLLIGVCVYLVTANFMKEKNEIAFLLRLINLSFIFVFIWSFMQIFFWQILNDYPAWMVSIQKFISTSGNLYRNRVTGFAYEPSWLAHQLNMLYLPLWFAASYKKYSAHRFKILGFTLENIFLFLGIITLFLTKSRIGLISFFACLLFIFILLNIKFTNLVKSKFDKKYERLAKNLLIPSFIIIYLSLIAVSVFVMSKIDPRMEDLLNIKTYQDRNLISIANDFSFAERILYWQTGWNIFNDHPISGVGIGNSGFFFEEYLPGFAWYFDEPRNLFFNATYQPNNKNLWIRLLSETGIIGFSLFIIWLILIFIEAKSLSRQKEKQYAFVGYAGLFALIAFFFEGFSIDSFALPYYWTIFGIISGVYLISSTTTKEQMVLDAG